MKKIIPPLLVVSLLANVALGLWIVQFDARERAALSATPASDDALRPPTPPPSRDESSARPGIPAPARANGVLATEASIGRALRTARTDGELRRAIAQLREAGFPPAVVRAIVDEVLRNRFAAREPKAPFWKRDLPTSEFVAATQALANERRALLEQLLGNDAQPAALLDAHQREQRYGAITDEKLNAVARVERDYDELRAKAFAEREANFINRVSTSMQQEQLMEAEKLRDLATILSPEELYQYELRNTLAARKLMTQLTAIDVSAAEFAQLYELSKKLDTEHPLSGGPADPAALGARMAAQLKVVDEARRVLPDDRYYQFLASHDPNYAIAARFTAKHPSVKPEATVELYKMQTEMHAALLQASQARQTGGAVKYPDLRAYEARLREILGSEVAEAYKREPAGRILMSAPPRPIPQGG